jgi:hypothetical protein
VSWLPESRTRDLAELAIAFALIQIAEWVPNPLQRVLFWITLAWALITTILAKPCAQTLGLRVPKMRSLWIVPVALLLSAPSLLGWPCSLIPCTASLATCCQGHACAAT